MKRKKFLDPNEILFGETTRRDLDEIAYHFFSTRMHNNLYDASIPNCYRHSKPGGIFSEEFFDFEYDKFGFKKRKNQEKQ